MGRPKIHVDRAAREKAYRERYAILNTRIQRDTAETLKRISTELDIPVSEVVNQLLVFALLNRNWVQEGKFTKWLPSLHAARPGDLGQAKRNPLGD